MARRLLLYERSRSCRSVLIKVHANDLAPRYGQAHCNIGVERATSRSGDMIEHGENHHIIAVSNDGLK